MDKLEISLYVGHGLMDLTDFISILKSHEFSGPELFEKDVISHFAVFDRKKDGYISQNDFIEILTQMQEVFSAQVCLSAQLLIAYICLRKLRVRMLLIILRCRTVADIDIDIDLSRW